MYIPWNIWEPQPPQPSQILTEFLLPECLVEKAAALFFELKTKHWLVSRNRDINYHSEHTMTINKFTEKRIIVEFM